MAEKLASLRKKGGSSKIKVVDDSYVMNTNSAVTIDFGFKPKRIILSWVYTNYCQNVVYDTRISTTQYQIFFTGASNGGQRTNLGVAYGTMTFNVTNTGFTFTVTNGASTGGTVYYTGISE